MISFFMSW